MKEVGLRVGGKKGELASRFEGYLRGDIESVAAVSMHSAKKSNDPIDLTDCTTTEELQALSAKALRTMCAEYGLAKSGKKPVLVARLMEFAAAGPNENDSGDENASASGDDADADSVFDVDVSAYPKAGAEREGDPEPVLEDVTDESELDGFRAGALKEYLREQGLRTSGKKDELKERVWRALCEESTAEDYPKKRGRSPGPGASPRANDSENDSE